jgi:hypothetical protein
VISGSTVRRNGGDGLLIRGPGSGHTAQGNLIKKNGGNGIAVDRRNNSLNTIVSNGVRGHAAPHFDLVDENLGCRRVHAGLETCRRARELATDPLHRAWADVTIGVVYVEMGDAWLRPTQLPATSTRRTPSRARGSRWASRWGFSGQPGARVGCAVSSRRLGAHWIRRADVALARLAARRFVAREQRSGGEDSA